MTAKARPPALETGPRRWRALVAIVLLGAALRLWGIDFGLPGADARPDEGIFVRRAMGMGAGDLDPHFYQYPSLHFYLTAAAIAAGAVLGMAAGRFRDLTDVALAYVVEPAPFFLAARVLSAAIGTLGILAVHAVARRVFGQIAAGAAALLLATAYLDVRNGHFATSDVPVAVACLLVLWASVGIVEGDRRRAPLLAGLALGLATSLKYHGVFSGVFPLAAYLLRPPPARRWRDLRLLVVVAAAAALAFAATSPFVLGDLDRSRADIAHLLRHAQLGRFALSGFPSSRPAERAWLFHARFTLPVGVGLPVLGLAGVGTVAAFARRRRPGILVVAGLLGLYLLLGPWRAHFTRYALPLAAPIAILAGSGAETIARRLPRRPALALAGLAAIPSLGRSIALDRLLAGEDTRTGAARYLCRSETGTGTGTGRVPLLLLATRRFDRYDTRFPHLPVSPATIDAKLGEYLGDRAAKAIERHARRPAGCGFDVVPLGDPGAAVADWLIEVRHPQLAAYEEDLAEADRRFLAERFEEARRFDPEVGAGARFEPEDLCFIPYAGLTSVSATGPTVIVYRRREPRPAQRPQRLGQR